jgi:hypothetical protein
MEEGMISRLFPRHHRGRKMRALPLAAVAVLLAGCTATSMHGSGQIQSEASFFSNPPPRVHASFGFSASNISQQCYVPGPVSECNARVLGSYTDPYVGVTMTFDKFAEGINTFELDGQGPCYTALVEYSGGRNVNYGTGELDMIACDFGTPNPNGSPDFIDVGVLSGPYAEYLDCGFLQSGNLSGGGNNNPAFYNIPPYIIGGSVPPQECYSLLEEFGVAPGCFGVGLAGLSSLSADKTRQTIVNFC